MNVPPILVVTMVLVITIPDHTAVHVGTDTQEETASMKSTNVHLIHVNMVVHVTIMSILIHVIVQTDIQGEFVRAMLTNARQVYVVGMARVTTP